METDNHYKGNAKLTLTGTPAQILERLLVENGLTWVAETLEFKCLERADRAVAFSPIYHAWRERSVACHQLWEKLVANREKFRTRKHAL